VHPEFKQGRENNMDGYRLKRKITLAGAILVCLCIITLMLYLGSLRSYIKLLLSLTPVVFGVIQLMASAASGAIIMELWRVLLPSVEPWSEKKHFVLVILVGVSIFLVSVILRVGWKASFIKTLVSGL
jgi:hypothetical protein